MCLCRNGVKEGLCVFMWEWGKGGIMCVYVRKGKGGSMCVDVGMG